MNDLGFLVICYLDFAIILSSSYCFWNMRHGRKLLLGEIQTEPEIPLSEEYRTEHDWRLQCTHNPRIFTLKGVQHGS